jgi:choline-sulfatase
MADRPNILLLMSDQHHKRVMRCAGDPIVHTPVLDGLAQRGTRFENAYCAFPLCGPSRMSFMTARHPSEIGCFSNMSQLSSDIPTFAHAFLSAGYETILSGRMHFVGFDQLHGFQKRLIGDVTPTAHVAGGWQLDDVLGSLVDTPGSYVTGLLKSGPGSTGYHAYDEAVADATVRWLKERGSASAGSRQPFLLVAGFASPHSPFVAPPQDYYRYHDVITPDLLPRNSSAPPHPLHQALRREFGISDFPAADVCCRVRAAYYGLTTFIDRVMGRVLDALESAQLAENTIVIYTSDHGEQLGEHGLWWKSTFFEGSVGVPLIVSWPGVLTPQRMVRRGPWKLNYYHGMPCELFNIDEDPHEDHDRSNDPACAAIKAELLKKVLNGWDPERIERQLCNYAQELNLVREWVRRTKPSEPDPCWFQTPPINRIDPIGQKPN